MQIKKIIILAMQIGIALAGANVVAQPYPNRLIRIFTTEPGSASDLASRLIGQQLTAGLGQPVVVENRAGGILSVETVAKAAPDGYTLLHYGSTVWLLPFMRDNVPWEAKDFAPITITTMSPNLIVVNPSLGVNSVKDLIALAKAKPGVLNYAQGSRGSSPHLATELFINMSGVNIVGVPYKGNVPAMNAMLSDEVQIVFSTAGSGAPFVKSGKLKALAVTSANPSALFPGVPPVAVSGGLPGYESVSIVGMFAPAKTPDTVIRRLNQEIVRIIKQPDVKEKFANAGAEVVGSTPEEFAATIKSEMTRMGKLIKSAGIRAD